MFVENVVWTLLPPLSVAVTAATGRLILGQRGSARFWIGVAVASGFVGVLLAPRCLCSDAVDVVVGSSLGAIVLGVLAGGLACSALAVMSRLRRASRRG